MNKSAMIDRLSAELDVSKKQAGEFYDKFLEISSETLQNEGTLPLAGFGNFKVSQRAARTGRNPATGETIDIPAKKVVGFKAARALNDKLND